MLPSHNFYSRFYKSFNQCIRPEKEGEGEEWGERGEWGGVSEE